MPDPATGIPIADGTTGDDRRLEAKHLWRTIAKAASIPNEIATSFSDVDGAQALGWLFR
jgi:hypothetical protein